MKILMFSAALALVCANPAAADCRTQRNCDPAAYGFEVMLGTIIQNALQRPPSQIYMAPPVYEAAPQQRPLSRDEWRQSLINEGNRFCATYPTDTHCQHQQ